MKASGRTRLAERNQNNINRAAWDGQVAIDQADSLAKFSKTLGDNIVEWKQEQNKKDELSGMRQRQKDEAERVTNEAKLSQLELRQANITKQRKLQEEAVAEQEKRFRLDKNRQALAEEIAKVKQMELQYEAAANEMQEIKGVLHGKSEADRIRLMSPHKQVGYVKEKLRVFKETLPDKVKRTLLTSETPIKLEGMEPFTAKELTENNMHNLPMHEAAVHALTDQIVEAAGVYGYSDEMLELAGVHEAIQKVKDDQMAVHRANYNKDASDNQLMQAAIEYGNIEVPTGDDVYLLFLKAKGGTNDKGTVGRTNAQAWAEVHKVLVKNSNGNPNYAKKIAAMELPEALRIKLGAKKGTTFGQQWPPRISALSRDIKKGAKAVADAENDWLKAQGTILENKIISTQQKTGEEFTPTQLNEIEEKFGKLGLPIPPSILKYNSQAQREYDDDKKAMAIQKGLNGGGLYPHDLQNLHPKLVGELMPEALKFEKLEAGEKGTEGAKAYERIGALLGKTFKSQGQDLLTRRKNDDFAAAHDAAFEEWQRIYLESRDRGASAAEAYTAATDGPGGVVQDLVQGMDSKYVTTTKERLDRAKDESFALTERLDNVDRARDEIKPQLKNAEVFLRSQTLQGSEPYLKILTDAITNGKPIYGLRATDEVEQALAYYNGVASAYPGFTGIQLLNWQIAAAKLQVDKEATQ